MHIWEWIFFQYEYFEIIGNAVKEQCLKSEVEEQDQSGIILKLFHILKFIKVRDELINKSSFAYFNIIMLI